VPSSPATATSEMRPSTTFFMAGQSTRL
jgi:hypothetical protein